MVYINTDRYMRVVHNRPTLTCLGNRRASSRRRIVAWLCACGPAVSALVDIIYYTTRPLSGDTMLCINALNTTVQLVVFWFRTVIFSILPIVILVYCNGMIVYTVRKHVNDTSFRRNLTRAKVLPFLTVICFICCWTPLIASAIYYRKHTECEEVKYVVLNVCIAIGNMHCITSPTLYIIMNSNPNSRLSSRSSFSLHCANTFSVPKQKHPASQGVTKKRSRSCVSTV